MRFFLQLIGWVVLVWSSQVCGETTSVWRVSDIDTMTINTPRDPFGSVFTYSVAVAKSHVQAALNGQSVSTNFYEFTTPEDAQHLQIAILIQALRLSTDMLRVEMVPSSNTDIDFNVDAKLLRVLPSIDAFNSAHPSCTRAQADPASFLYFKMGGQQLWTNSAFRYMAFSSFFPSACRFASTPGVKTCRFQPCFACGTLSGAYNKQLVFSSTIGGEESAPYEPPTCNVNQTPFTIAVNMASFTTETYTCEVGYINDPEFPEFSFNPTYYLSSYRQPCVRKNESTLVFSSGYSMYPSPPQYTYNVSRLDQTTKEATVPNQYVVQSNANAVRVQATVLASILSKVNVSYEDASGDQFLLSSLEYDMKRYDYSIIYYRTHLNGCAALPELLSNQHVSFSAFDSHAQTSRVYNWIRGVFLPACAYVEARGVSNCTFSLCTPLEDGTMPAQCLESGVALTKHMFRIYPNKTSTTTVCTTGSNQPIWIRALASLFVTREVYGCAVGFSTNSQFPHTASTPCVAVYSAAIESNVVLPSPSSAHRLYLIQLELGTFLCMTMYLFLIYTLV
jgi:hypothetical protein